MKKPIGVYNDENLYLTISSYSDNGRIYLGLETEDELYADITINLSDRLIEDDNCIFISGHVDNDLQDFLIEKEIIEEPYNVMQYNMGKYNCSRVNFEKIKEYDPEGFEDFEKKLKNDEIEL